MPFAIAAGVLTRFRDTTLMIATNVLARTCDAALEFTDCSI
jgi:hypothetical protein